MPFAPIEQLALVPPPGPVFGLGLREDWPKIPVCAAEPTGMDRAGNQYTSHPWGQDSTVAKAGFGVQPPPGHRQMLWGQSGGTPDSTGCGRHGARSCYRMRIIRHCIERTSGATTYSPVCWPWRCCCNITTKLLTRSRPTGPPLTKADMWHWNRRCKSDPSPRAPCS